MSLIVNLPTALLSWPSLCISLMNVSGPRAKRASTTSCMKRAHCQGHHHVGRHASLPWYGAVMKVGVLPFYMPLTTMLPALTVHALPLPHAI
jgi:hypothetical protein